MIVGGTSNKAHVDTGKAQFLNIWTATRAKLERWQAAKVQH